MFIRKSGDGNYYLATSHTKGRVKNMANIKKVFIIKDGGSHGYIGEICTPKKLIGKRVMLQLIFLENKK